MDSSSFSLTNLAAALGFFTLLHTIFFFFYRKFRSYQSYQETIYMEENKTMADSSLVPSSSPRNLKHHVFPSFHGADVRRSFLSHILKEFKSKAIDLFIDNNLERGKPIGPELIDAIRGSRIAIVLLSKNYASSTWCLNELVEIIRCREMLGQIVMVIFYEVDPTNVKKQTGEFGKVFRKTCKGKTEHDIRRWKHALADVAKIAGYHSRNWDNEAEMIEDIANDVSNKLNLSTPSRDFDNLVGMETHMFNMGPLLRLDLKEVRMIGIWGPPGIGKTTIARFLFNRHSQDFQLSVFMENIKARYPIPASCSDDYNVKLELQEQFMSKLLSQKGFKISHLGIVEDRLKNNKVFVVLDDVNHLIQLEAMAKETRWFGPSSRIIITTQDRGLLQKSGFNHIYKVGLPSSSEAFQMFCMYAFGQKYPKDGFEELATEVTSLVGELPLGLRVMGSYFQGKSNLEDWKKVLPRLKTRLDGDIESILKFSYDALHDEDKNLFLHIACFFRDEEIYIVKSCLANSLLVSNVSDGIDVLAEKSLISLDEGRVTMHNLLIRLGNEIVRKQSVSKPGKRQFLVGTRDIDEVLSDDKADTSNVIGIDILAWPKDIAVISEGTLERFYNLQFLRIMGKGVNLRRLNSLPRKLRYLTWDTFPLTCLPSDFQLKFLVILRMRSTQLEKLWDGIQPLNNLKVMDLSSSRCLRVLPDLSSAINLYELNIVDCVSVVELPSIGNAIHLQNLRLSFCKSLVKLHPSVGNVIHLRELNVVGCSSLEQLPSSIGNAIHLRELDFSFCSSLEQLPSSIGNLINLKKLNLQCCSRLVQLPSSIGNAIHLEELNLWGCKRLVHLPSSIENCINLRKLDFQLCSSLVELPTSIGNLINLEKLYLWDNKSLVELPSSVGNLINLKELYLSDCKNLVELPSSVGNLINLETLVLRDCSSLVELPSSMRNLVRLSKLELKGCLELKVCLTNINLESLKELDLSDCSLLNIEDLKPNGIVPLLSESELSSCETQELSPLIKRISRLHKLVLSGMQNLVSLPQLPYSLSELDAGNCESLERLNCSFGNPDICLKFAKCYKLNEEARDLIIHTRTNKYVVLPGEGMPSCFTYRASGSSLTVKLNQNPLCTSRKFKACIILAGEKEFESKRFTEVKVYCSIKSKQNAPSTLLWKEIYLALPDHLYLFEVEAMEVTTTELVFEFELVFKSKTREIKECGIFQLDKEAYGE